MARLTCVLWRVPTGIAAYAVTGMEAMGVTLSHDPTGNGIWGLLPQALDPRCQTHTGIWIH
jgi:hypothetical protein